MNNELSHILLVGLGNPGPEYIKNRHNIGFMAIDAIAHEYGISSFRKKYKGQMAEGKIDGRKVILLKPETYMNLSGASVAELASYYKITPDRIVVFHDELDLPFGKIRLKVGGGAAGHNGLKSLDQYLGNQNYVRVRIGIDHPGDRDMVSHYVLADFAKDESAALDDILSPLAKYLPLALAGDYELYMTRVAASMPAHLDNDKKERKNGI